MPMGIVRWIDPERGAFIEEVSKGSTSRQFSASQLADSVFAPKENLEAGGSLLKEGQLVYFEEDQELGGVAATVKSLV